MPQNRIRRTTSISRSLNGVNRSLTSAAPQSPARVEVGEITASISNLRRSTECPKIRPIGNRNGSRHLFSQSTSTVFVPPNRTSLECVAEAAFPVCRLERSADECPLTHRERRSSTDRSVLRHQV